MASLLKFKELGSLQPFTAVVFFLQDWVAVVNNVATRRKKKADAEDKIRAIEESLRSL